MTEVAVSATAPAGRRTARKVAARAATIPAAAHVVLAALLLLVVAAANGRPAAFPDTASYYSQGRYIVRALGLAAATDADAARRDPTALGADRGNDGQIAASIAGARSPLYGLLLYGARRIGSVWALAALQSLIAACLLWTTARAALRRRAPATFHAVNLALALGSGLPLFAAFLIPDVFAGLAVGSVALLLVYRDRLTRTEQAGVAGLIVISALLHATILVLAAALAATAAAAAACISPRLRRRLAGRAGLTAAVVFAAGLLAFGLQGAVNASLGQVEGQPPFLAARVLADGAGRLELKAACRSDDAPWALCRYRRLPLDNSEDVLWAVEPGRGVFNVATLAVRRRIQAEQLRFTLAAIARAPLTEAGAALRNVGEQLALYQVDAPLRNPADFLAHPVLARTAIPDLEPDMAPCRRKASACKARFPYGLLMWAHGVVLLLSTTFLGWRLSKGDARALLCGEGPRSEDLKRLLAFQAFVGLGVLLNAVLCGALSGPFARYEARLIWLWPVGALLLAGLIGWPRPDRPRRRARGAGVTAC